MKKRQNAGLNRLTEDDYRYYTRRIWGMSGNYQICIDTSLGEDYVLNTVLDLVKKCKSPCIRKQSRIRIIS